MQAKGDLHFRGTLQRSKEVAVGFQTIRMRIALDTDANQEQLASLMKLTERYCLVQQTLTEPLVLEVSQMLVREPVQNPDRPRVSRFWKQRQCFASLRPFFAACATRRNFQVDPESTYLNVSQIQHEHQINTN